MLLGLVVGYVKMQSDVDHMKGDVTTVRTQVQAIYNHLAFSESGQVGPAPDLKP